MKKCQICNVHKDQENFAMTPFGFPRHICVQCHRSYLDKVNGIRTKMEQKRLKTCES